MSAKKKNKPAKIRKVFYEVVNSDNTISYGGSATLRGAEELKRETDEDTASGIPGSREYESTLSRIIEVRRRA